MSMNIVTLLYLVASVFFIQALKGLSHPTTSIRGNIFGMAGDRNAAATAKAIVALETALARAQWTKVDLRDPIKGYNKTEVAKLATLAPGVAASGNNPGRLGGGGQNNIMMDGISTMDTGNNGILTAAYRAKVPIFCPAIADSSIGMGLSQARHRDQTAGVADVIGDILESANIVIRKPSTATIVLGGGTPKNFINQASVQAEFYSSAVSGHRYALQIVTDVPHFGGASGSSLEEAQSWGKLATDAERVTVHADVTLALPLLASALASSAQELLDARKPPRFDLSGRVMVVNGRPLPEARFEAR